MNVFLKIMSNHGVVPCLLTDDEMGKGSERSSGARIRLILRTGHLSFACMIHERNQF